VPDEYVSRTQVVDEVDLVKYLQGYISRIDASDGGEIEVIVSLTQAGVQQVKRLCSDCSCEE